jgi:glycosyltransferase involved in cell wall biosynthesis
VSTGIQPPRVTVAMPVFNGEAYLREAIHSVLRQTLADFELLAIDDGSTDRSSEVLRSFDDPRIRVLHNPRNLGLAATRNRAIREAAGSHIAWLDCDDLSFPRRLERQVQLLDARPAIGLCGTWVRTIASGPVAVWCYPTEPEVIHSRMVFDNPIATSSVMVRRTLLLDHGLQFRSEFPPAEDYDLWERVAGKSGVSNVPEVLTGYRLHETQTSKIHTVQQQRAVWAVQERQLQALGIDPTEEEKEVHRTIGVEWRFHRDCEFMRASGAWLGKLLEANERHRRYPTVEFHGVLAERWFYVCNAVAGAGRVAWRTYWESPVSNGWKLSTRQRLEFRAKCMLRWRGAGH